MVLRVDSVTEWEVMAADAACCSSTDGGCGSSPPVTRLLIDDSLLVDRASGATVLAFRDRAHPKLREGERLIADQGEWSIVDVGRR